MDHNESNVERFAQRQANSRERRTTRLAGKSSDGLEQFFRETYGDLVGFARRRTDYYSAEDAVSDFLVKVLAKGQEPTRQAEDGIEPNPYHLAALGGDAHARVGLRRIGFRATANNTTSGYRKSSSVDLPNDAPDHSQAAQLDLLANDRRSRLTHGSTFEQPEDCADRVDLDRLHRRSDRTTQQVLDDIRYDRGTRQEIADRAGMTRTDAQRLIAGLDSQPEVAGPRADAARTKRSKPKKRSATPAEAS
jgi:hypothetical protein